MSGRLAVEEPCPTCEGTGRNYYKTTSYACGDCGGNTRWVVTDTPAIAVADVLAIIDAEKAKWMRCEHDKVDDLLDAIRAAIEKAAT